MANEELTALLKTLQGTGAGRVLQPGLLAQLPAVLAGEPEAGESRGASIASRALQTVGGGLTLLPMVTGLLRLFGVGGGKEEPAPLEKFALPQAIRAEGGVNSAGETVLIDRGAGDRIRTYGLPAAAGRSTAAPALAESRTESFAGAPERPAAPAAGQSITVNVQAMDSQSFLDRREDIARAVREAMLQSHSLNDIVSEL